MRAAKKGGAVPAERKPRFRALRIALLSFATLVLAFISGCLIFYVIVASETRLDESKLKNLPQALLIYDSKGTEQATVSGSQNRQCVPLSKVPQYVRDAFIAVEDVRFYQHGGLDIKRIFGALWDDITSGKLKEGASTISQQLIKLTHLTSEKTIMRKVKEAVMAIQLERSYSKDEILEMYLNTVYFGNGAYGIEAASKAYFGKDVSELTLSQGALLAGVIKSPSNYAPHLDFEAAIKRRDVVLSLMEQYGFIPAEAEASAKAEKIALATQTSSRGYPYGYFTDAALDEARDALGISSDELMTGGYRIYTTLDPAAQKACEDLFLDKANFPPDAADGTLAQSAMVVIDPETGGVSALMGGREYVVKHGLDRATGMYRQPGSAIKPVLVYAPALELGICTPATVLYDSPQDFNGYKPDNFGGK
ncbi:MAG: transglycosylase domain-containing protein, partial [Bacillota bacterium]|nr:transglycosylase domain-containing protein [Bacillota bacterium]